MIVWGLVCSLHAPASAERRVGVMLDVGLPDGISGSVVFRPRDNVRLHAGASYNLISPGVRVGATLRAERFITPSLAVEVGHYLSGNANLVIGRLNGDPNLDEPLLRDISYDYANAQLGLELGTSRFTFVVHGGLSWVRMTVHDLQESIDSHMDGEQSMVGAPSVEIRSDPKLRVIAPSARVGMVVYF